MRKMIVLLFAAGILLSCKEDYNCKCTHNDGTTTTTTNTPMNGTEKKMKSKCEYEVDIAGTTTVCVLEE